MWNTSTSLLILGLENWEKPCPGTRIDQHTVKSKNWPVTLNLLNLSLFSITVTRLVYLGKFKFSCRKWGCVSFLICKIKKPKSNTCTHSLSHTCVHSHSLAYTLTHMYTQTNALTLSCITHTLSQHSHTLMNTQAPRTAGTEAESLGVLLSDVAEEILNPDSGSHFSRPRLCFPQFQSLPRKQQGTLQS